MKTKNIILATSFLAYLYLFYHTTAGINHLLFSTILVGALLFTDSKFLSNKPWIFVALGAITTGLGVALYGNDLSYIANLITLAALAGLSFSPNSSLVFACTHGALSYLVKPAQKVINFFALLNADKPKEPSKKDTIFTRNRILSILLPMLVVLVFTAMYSGSNPLFSWFLQDLGTYISWEFISFSLYGFYVVYFFFNQYAFAEVAAFDAKKGNVLLANNPTEQTIFGATHHEFSAAKLTFVLLNLLLLMVNSIDIAFIFNPSKEVIDYSHYIHQGINASIFSVLMAILVVLYFFRGNLNFIAENRGLKLLAVLWLVLNIVLLLTCFHKNFSYIDAHGLTPKRIGVYAYLLVTFIGLLLTWLKIAKRKSNMFLVRSNFWSLFLLLSLSTTIHWNQIIFDHNLTHHPELSDRYYFNQSPESALIYLVDTWEKTDLDCSHDLADCQFQKIVRMRKEDFIKAFASKSWPSWTLKDYKIYKAIQ